MVVSYVGNRKNLASDGKPFNTEWHITRTLEKLGHEVNFIQEDELRFGTLPSLVQGSDMFLFTRTWGDRVLMADLQAIKKMGIPTVSWHLDLYIGLSRKNLHKGKSTEEIFATDPFWQTDFVFTPDGDPRSEKKFKECGVNHFYLMPGVFEDEAIALQPTVQPMYDVLFTGGGDRVGSLYGYGHPEYPYRDQLVTFLYDTYGERFKKYGHPQPTIRGMELNQLYANTKVTVGDTLNLNFNHERYTSDRLTEATGRFSFLIYPRIKGISDVCFKDGVEVVYYEHGNLKDLKEKIDYYLIHDEERERIRRAGHERCKLEHTYTQRAQEVLAIVFAKQPGSIS